MEISFCGGDNLAMVLGKFNTCEATKTIPTSVIWAEMLMRLAALVADRFSCGGLMWTQGHPMGADVVVVKGGIW